jgi:putative transcriptional regulator
MASQPVAKVRRARQHPIESPDAMPKITCSLDIEMARLKLSTRELAKRTGVTELAISKWRRNAFQMIDMVPFARVCQELELQPGELLHLEIDAND